jgi:hypothetical protein
LPVIEPADVFSELDLPFSKGREECFQLGIHAGKCTTRGRVGEGSLLVVFDYDRATHWVRVVTSYEPTSERWWKAYAKEKGWRI